jgi:hypothetical protein
LELGASYYTNMPLPTAITAFYKTQADSGPTFYNCYYLAFCAGNNNWNYYDAALGFYRLYYRTHQTVYLTKAQALADLWYTLGINSGYGWGAAPAPRTTALQGEFIRAAELYPGANRFPALYQMISNYMNNGATCGTPPPCLNFGAISHQIFDIRENAYVGAGIAAGAKLDPDATRHAQYCSWLASAVTGWSGYQVADGHWPENSPGENGGGYLGLSPPVPANNSGIFGGPPWRTDIPIRSLQLAYEALNDTSSPSGSGPGSQGGCKNTSSAATALSTIKKALDWTWSYGRLQSNGTIDSGHGDRGVLYDVGYPGSGLRGANGPGTVSVNLGSNTVTGVGAGFTKITGLCGGTYYIGFSTGSASTVYLVTSCASDTQLTISPAYGSLWETADASAVNWAYTPPNPTTCTGSLSSYCEYNGNTPPNTQGMRDLTRLMPGMTSWYYAVTGDKTYQQRAADWYGVAYGGPSSGPNSGTPFQQISLPCSDLGPSYARCLGYISDWASALPDCASHAPPCLNGGNVYAPNVLGKGYGQGQGFSDSQRTMPDILGGVQPLSTLTVYVGWKPATASVTSVNIIVTQPSGVQTTTNCSSSPCAATLDRRQGPHLIMVQHLSAGRAILAQTSQYVSCGS